MQDFDRIIDYVANQPFLCRYLLTLIPIGFSGIFLSMLNGLRRSAQNYAYPISDSDLREACYLTVQHAAKSGLNEQDKAVAIRPAFRKPSLWRFFCRHRCTPGNGKSMYLGGITTNVYYCKRCRTVLVQANPDDSYKWVDIRKSHEYRRKVELKKARAKAEEAAIKEYYGIGTRI